MKSLAELEAIRQRTLEKVAMRKEGDDAVRVVVGMATCGIAAGARPVLNALVEEVDKQQAGNATVYQTGCIGLCRYEPIVEVFEGGKERITYVSVTPEMAARIVKEHIKGGQPVVEYTIGAVEK